MKRNVYLYAGIALAVLAFFLVQGITAGASKTVSVVVASKFIPAGQVITEGDVQLKQVPPALAPKSSFTSIKEVIGQRLSIDRAPGDVISREQIGAETFKLEQGYAAVSIQVDQRRGLAGKIAPGDKVSLVGVFQPLGMGEEENKPLAKVVLSGVEVLFVSRDFVYTPTSSTTASLAGAGGMIPTLPQRQAEKGVLVLKVPAFVVPLVYTEYGFAGSQITVTSVYTKLVNPLELVAYLDAQNALYVIKEPEEGVLPTPGLRLEDMMLPWRRMERREETWMRGH